jgi:DNA polymerase-3 subunit alpha
VIDDAVKNVRLTADPKFDIEPIPLDDPKTYTLLNSGRTVGIFQLESGGMQNASKLVGISNIDDINAISALYRPGPMQFIPDYARGKKDPAAINYPHPLLEPVLKETYGIIVYQEQVMECARVIAGYTLGGADMLRRAMGKKDVEGMAKERVKFVDGAKKTREIDEKKANEIFDLLNKFAQYGFNKSHSAAYAMVAYQTAYLKANYPVQFMAALLTAELGNTEKVAHFIAECEAMGLVVLGPDINESRENFTPVGAKIRFGLAGIKGVGEQAAQKIIEEREKNGPYTDFEDLARRVDGRAINKRVLEHLVKTGAFDFSGAPRKKLFEGIDAALAGAASQARDRAAGQFSLLDMLAEEPKPSKPASRSKKVEQTETASDFTSTERLTFEKELLGFYVSGHPLNAYTGLAEAIDTFAVDQLLNQPDRTEFRLCGIVGTIVKKLSKKDNRPWAAFTLATKRASVALNMFADAYAAYSLNLIENTPVLVQGNIIVGQDGARINVKECYPLENFVSGSVKRITWLVNPQHGELNDFLRFLRETLNQNTGDTKISIGFVYEQCATAISETSNALGWKLSPAKFQQLRSHPAVVGVELETKRLELKQDKRWAKRS